MNMFGGESENTHSHSHSHHHDHHRFLPSAPPPPLPLSFHGGSATAPAAFSGLDLVPAHQSFEPHDTERLLHLHRHPLERLLHLHRHPLHPHDQPAEEAPRSRDDKRDKDHGGFVPSDPWSNDEVVELLKMGSSMENWYTDLTWEHVSRKLAELGFNRSAKNCKEKYEEEGRFFDCTNHTKNQRVFLSELEQVYHHSIASADEKSQHKNENPTKELEDKHKGQDPKSKSIDKKRKRDKKLQMLKGFCEDVVRVMMAQQEEMHNKLLEDMLKRDEEKIEREEAWKRREMERLNEDIESRAQKQASADYTQCAIFELLKKFSSSSSYGQKECYEEEEEGNVEDLLNTSNSFILAEEIEPIFQQKIQKEFAAHTSGNPNSPHTQNTQKEFEAPTSSSLGLAPKNPRSPHTENPRMEFETPNSSSLGLAPGNPNSSHNTQRPNKCYSPNLEGVEHTKRWPGDEVLSLINLRCSLCGSGEDKESTKGPLWERVSQKMLEMGYKRSSKRCKEKWENINKYYRKNKGKRSLGSRTCPYFQQLSTLYGQGKLLGPIEGLETSSVLPEN